MIGNILGATGFITSILLIVLFVIGLRYSKIHSFKPGIYFFLLLIVHKICTFVLPFWTRNYIDYLLMEHKGPLMGMSNGEFVVFLSLIPEVLLFAAFLFLIVGLRSFWNVKSTSQK